MKAIVMAVMVFSTRLAIHAADVQVPGTACLYLAGAADGTQASKGAGEPPDVAPAQSPVLVDVPLRPGMVLEFRATGRVNHAPGFGFDGPDGAATDIQAHSVGAEHGISDIVAPLNALLGVFLGPYNPEGSVAPPALDFSQRGSIDYRQLTPAIRQVFFIGDGVTASGLHQKVVVPFGATRLFLGTADAYGWANNGGAFMVSITSISPTITWDNPADITYGSALSSSQLNASASVAGSFVYSPGVGTLLRAGAGQVLSAIFTPADANYAVVTATVLINVLKAIPSIIWNNPADITYGIALGNAQLNATASVPGSFIYTPVAETALPAGVGQVLNVEFTPVDANYATARASVSITVHKAILAVGADNANRTYGDTNPVFHGIMSGFVNGDTVAVVSGVPAFSCAATAASPVGAYDIVPAVGTLSAANYDFVATNRGILRVTAAPLVVQAENRTRRYGETNPVFGGTVTGLCNGDTITVAYGCAAGPESPAGRYSIVPSLVDPAGKLPNYGVTIENGTLTVIGVAALHGVASDALSKQPLPGVTVSLGQASQTTGMDGAFVFTNLAPGGLDVDFTASLTAGPAPLTVRFSNTSRDGGYSLQADKSGYARYSYAPIELAAGEDKAWSFSLSPRLQGLRLVLNWGTNPKDLDSHLLTPKINGTAYHIQYGNRYFGQTNLPPFAQLDADATAGYGPETITIASNTPGIYRYYVRNYKDDQGNTGDFANSDAVVQIYSTSGLIQTVRVPTVGVGDFWDVCLIDGASGKITLVNQIVAREPKADDDGTIPPDSGDNGGGNTNSQPKLLWSFGDGTTSEQEDPERTSSRRCPGICAQWAVESSVPHDQ